MKKLYLFSWINFGKYRRTPMSLEDIIKTPDGRTWLRWLMGCTYNFSFDQSVVDLLTQEENAGHVLQPAGSQQL